MIFFFFKAQANNSKCYHWHHMTNQYDISKLQSTKIILSHSAIQINYLNFEILNYSLAVWQKILWIDDAFALKNERRVEGMEKMENGGHSLQ